MKLVNRRIVTILRRPPSSHPQTQLLHLQLSHTHTNTHFCDRKVMWGAWLLASRVSWKPRPLSIWAVWTSGWENPLCQWFERLGASALLRCVFASDLVVSAPAACADGSTGSGQLRQRQKVLHLKLLYSRTFLLQKCVCAATGIPHS